MELRQLRYLVAVSQELSFTKAAIKTNVAQPALSRQIRKLENELGLPLVDRTSRRVQLTPAGQRLAARAISILDQIDNFRLEALDITQLLTGRLSIGTTQTPGPLNIARLLHEFYSLHPGIELAVREEFSVTIADQLRRDEIDIGFVSGIPEASRVGLDLHLIADEPLVVCLPDGHALAGRKEIALDDLRGEAFVVFPEGATIRDTFDDLAAAHGLAPKVAFVTTATDRMRELIGLGLGIGLLPLSDATGTGANTTVARLANRALVYKIHLARRAGRRHSAASNAMAALVERRSAPTQD